MAGAAWRARCLDALVHLNGLLPCFVVYFALATVGSAYLAVFLYEALCLVGFPLFTLWLRGFDSTDALATRANVRPLVLSLLRPNETRKCQLVWFGASAVVGFGGFAAYLAVVQREFEHLGVTAAIKNGIHDEGLITGTVAEDVALLLLYCWFCAVNPVLEEIFWRGYMYVELGRMADRGKRPRLELALPSRSSSPASALVADREPEAKTRHRDFSTGNHRWTLLPSRGQTGGTRWLLSAYFGSFHGVVVYVFVRNVWAGLAVFCMLALASRCWIWLGERKPFGFSFITAFHAGADVTIILVATACGFGWAKGAAYGVALAGCVLFTLNGFALLGLAWRHERFPPLPCDGRADSPENDDADLLVDGTSSADEDEERAAAATLTQPLNIGPPLV